MSFLLCLGMLLVASNGDARDQCDPETLKDLGLTLVSGFIPHVGSFLKDVLNIYWPSDCAFKKIKKELQTEIKTSINETARSRTS